MGIRTSKTVTIGPDASAPTAAHTATYYVVDKNRDYAQVLAEWTAQWTGTTAPGPQTDALAVTYRYGHDLIHQTRDPLTTPVTHHFHYDGQLSTRHLTNSTADPLTNPPQVTDSYTYGAYGELLSTPGPTPNNYLYTGEQLDPDLGAANTPDTGSPAGLCYLRARYYNPGHGRFTGRDPFGGSDSEPQTLHKYLYVGGDPANRLDPTGQMALIAFQINMLNRMLGHVYVIEITWTRLLIGLLILGMAAASINKQWGFQRLWYAWKWMSLATDYNGSLIDDAVKEMRNYWPGHNRMDRLANELTPVGEEVGGKERRLRVRLIEKQFYIEGMSLFNSLYVVKEGTLSLTPLEFAMLLYCEWQHHPRGGNMNETEAQSDLRRVRDQLPPDKRTPFINSLVHKP